MSPRPDETLAQFLDRVLDARTLSVNALGRRLAEHDGPSSIDSQVRAVRRWTAGTTESLKPENAQALSEILNASFDRFVASRGSIRDLLTEALERLRDVEQRLSALEQ